MTYAEDSGLWSSLASDFKARLPLRQLVWQSPGGSSRNTGAAQRIISSLDIDIKPYSSDLFPMYAPGGLSQNSLFMHIFFVGCEDLEYYKNNVRPKLKEWLEVVTNKKHQEWMIVHFLGGEAAKTRPASLFAMGGGTVFDKIKFDFSLKKDRCMQFRQTGNEVRDTECWNDLFDRVKEGFVSAITQQVAQQEEDTRRLEQQRLMPGWNYCQYFLLKESLASTYELIGFYDESLLHYDELEAMFYQTLTEQGAPWFHKFGGVEAGDDCPDILNTDRKPYRDNITQSNITIFDFREYLFARQCRLLFLMNSPADVCQRTKIFVVAFAKTLQEYRVSLIRNFRESWSYSVCMRIVRECDNVVQGLPLSSGAAVLHDALRAEIVQIARFQLDRLGAFHKLCVNPLHPLDAAEDGDGPGGDDDSENASRPLTNPELVKALDSTESFDKLYHVVTDMAVRGFESSGRPRAALALQSDLAFLYFSRQNYAKAAAIWDQTAFKYAEFGWHQIETMLMERLACCLYLASQPHLLAVDKAESFVDELNQAAISMSDPITRANSELFGVSIASVTNRVGDDDDLVFELRINSVLVKDFTMTLLTLTLTAGDGKEMVCTNSNVVLHPGKNTVHVRAPKSTVPGNYSPSVFQMMSGKLHFNYDLLPSDRKKSVRMHETLSSLSMSASLPLKRVSNEPDTHVVVEILTRGNSIKGGRLAISALTSISLSLPKSLTGRVNAATDSADVQVRETVCEIVDGKITVPDMGEQQRLRLLLPYSHAADSRNTEHKLKMVLTSVAGDGKKRLFSSIVKLSLVPLFDVLHSVVDSTSGSLVQMAVMCKDGPPMRITSLGLSAASGAAVRAIAIPSEQIAFPNTPIHLLFQLDSVTGTSSHASHNQSLSLHASFVSLADDRVWHARHTGFLTTYLRKHLIASMDPIEYASFGTLDTFKLDLESLVPLLADEDPSVRDSLVALLTKLYERLSGAAMADARHGNAAIPSALSYTFSHHAPHLFLDVSFKAGDVDVMLGDALPCTVTVTPTSWTLASPHADTVDAVLELDLDLHHFAIAGKRRQAFKLSRLAPTVFHLHLVPLMAGQVLLPRVIVRVNSIAERDVGIAYINNGGQLDVMPRRQSAKIFVADADTGGGGGGGAAVTPALVKARLDQMSPYMGGGRSMTTA
ncbi:hypothetical protein BC831DRAFT_469279 [Entophlyctis helioformis]|nr:hypothetical protein BC831DRAFT_469279 [Entophlyctis helioformis]